MKVVILCGGMGTRLREETEYRPKPMVEIGGRPILWHIMKTFAHYGLKEFILCLGYKGHIIKEYFLNYEAMNNDFTITLGRNNGITYHGQHYEQDYQVTLAETGLESMTGWRVKLIEKYVDNALFIVTYGDGLIDLNIDELIKFHHNHGRLATVTTVRPAQRFGTVRLDSTGVVTNFAEKPKLNDWISAGFFVFNREVFDYIDADPSCVLERNPLEQLATASELVAYRHDGYFYAMDTYREYIYLNQLWDKGEAFWKVWD
jgi:glucose-1-phosphate cytidylyltransferase